ncbi:MAG TPA: hypothetical protein VF746_02160 [Longimicrobium sp.]|jgi:hypothetical protein
MRNRTTAILVAGCAIVFLPACHDDGLGLHGCPTEYDQGWRFLQFELQHTDPSTCPVYLSSPGVTRTAGGVIVDPSPRDADVGTLQINDSRGIGVQTAVGDFQDAGNGTWEARLTLSYSAGRVDLKPDKATFLAWLRSNVLAAADMTITYTDQVRVTIGGPGTVLSGSTATWTADVTAGEPPFTYRWYRDWELVGTEAAYSEEVGGEGRVELRLDVYDSRGEATSLSKSVYVTGCQQVIC